MRRSSLGIAAAVVMTALLLTGCTTLDQIVGTESWKEWAPEQTSLQVYGDGVVAETIFDHLDQAWYTGDELQDMIARSMNEYNAANGENSLNVTEYSDEGGDVRVRLVYRTAEDYARYNNVVFFSGSMLDAQIHPEKHRDLIVRVAGYSAFFNVLSRQTQDDIIARTEQSL